MAKDDKEKDKTKGLDKCLSYLLDSKTFEKLITKIRDIWQEHSVPQNASVWQADAVPSGIVSKEPPPEPRIVYKDKIIKEPVEIPITPTWASELEQQYQLWQTVQHLSALHTIFNQKNADEPNDLLNFIVCSSQWENVVRVWKQLAEQCNANKQRISDDELALLDNCVTLYNRTLTGDKQASLIEPKAGDDFDFKQHDQIGSGDTIKQVLLPALLKPTGEKVWRAIVICG